MFRIFSKSHPFVLYKQCQEISYQHSGHFLLRINLCCGFKAVNALGRVPVRPPVLDMKPSTPIFDLKVCEYTIISTSDFRDFLLNCWKSMRLLFALKSPTWFCKMLTFSLTVKNGKHFKAQRLNILNHFCF